MFRKKQLNVNIKELDLQIGKLSEELKELERDNKYETLMDKLKDLTELRITLAKSVKEDETSGSLDEMDKQIEELTVKLANYSRDDEYITKMNRLEELTKVRCQLAESRSEGSLAPVVVSGMFGLASILTVLYYEDKEIIITSKAFNMATSMFRGNR